MGAHPRRAGACATFAVLSLVAGLIGWAGPSPSTADTIPPGQLVGTVAASNTPHVLDGRVLSVVQVGNTIILGGTFTRARNANSSTEMVRNRLLAFDATTGLISPTFNPSPNADVNVVVPSGDGTTVYVGGRFTSINGVARQRLARISVSDGAVVAGFNPGSVNGQVRDAELSGDRLWVAGAFTHIGGRAQRALTTLNPTTGAPQTYMSLPITGQHRPGVGTTQVLKIDVSPQTQRLVAIGNFDQLSGVVNHQLLVLDTSGASAQPSTFRTSFYTSPCSQSFDTYMRDVDFSPDGSYFVVGTTGAYGGSTTACDTIARFETGTAGADVAPSWVDYSGGDTTTAVEATQHAVYVGGHQRWWNNPFAGDTAGPGAVSRPGLVAVSPVNGLPFSWNPTRTLGVGVFDFLLTGQGLWIASDTDRIGAYQYRGRIARMPLNGVAFPAYSTPTLPGTVYGGTAAGLTQRTFDGTTAGPVQAGPTGGPAWGTVRGAFMLNGWLYVAHSNGDFTRRTFDGTTYGPSVPVDTHHRLATLTTWRSDITSMTGMFYDRGRIYFTRTGSSELSYRYFNPQSDLVGAARLTASGPASGFSPALVRGMFTAGPHVYWASADGVLRRVGWAQNNQSGFPNGPAEPVSGPGIDGQTWPAGSLFVHQAG